jgi:hypothetical protein
MLPRLHEAECELLSAKSQVPQGVHGPSATIK